jgi:ribose transport system permease protein
MREWGRKWLSGWELRRVAPLASLALLMSFFCLAAPGFLSLATFQAVLKQGSAMAVVAVGLTYVLICGEIDLAVGMTALWSACLCGWLFENLGSAPGLMLATIALPLASCLLVGLVAGVLTVWSRLPSFIITLAMMFVTEGMARWLTKSRMFRLPELLGVIGNQGLPLGGRFTLPYSALFAIGALALGHAVLRYTRFGRYVYATGGNRQAARLSGIHTGAIVVAVLAISALMAGLGGLINAGRMTQVTLDQNKELLLSSVAAVVLGGTSLFGGEGSMPKTLVGVLTFTVLNVGLMQITWINDLARQLLTGLVLTVALVVNGVLAKRSAR